MSHLTMSSGEAYWNLALECALRRSKGKCQVNFDDERCSRCRIYLRKFTQASEPAIQMLMLQADTTAHDDKIRNRLHHMKYAALMLLFIGLAYYGWHRDKSFINAPTESTSLNRFSVIDVNNSIDDTLVIVDRAMRRKVDVNGDGLTNCIDAAVLFYKHYPFRSQVCIELNYNPYVNPEFNHLFNCVLIDGNWRAIEPQAKYLGRSKWMRECWGNRYDNKYNTEATSSYARFAK